MAGWGAGGAECADAVLRIMSDKDERARLAAAGPVQARSFDWERCADATSAVIARLLDAT